MPHGATILPIAFENQICRQVDQVGNTAAVSWGFGICPYIELGTVGSFKTERVSFMSALDQWLNKRTGQGASPNPERRRSFPGCWLSPQRQGVLAYMHWQLFFSGDKVLM